MACAFTQKVRKFLTMFKDSKKYRTIHYGHPDSVTDAHEHVDVITTEIQEQAYGKQDDKTKFFQYGYDDVCVNTFNRNAAAEILKRKRYGDIVLAFWGTAKAACDAANKDNDLIVVEPGIGCGYAFAPFRCYESHPLKAAFIGTDKVSRCAPEWYWRVVPNYFDVRDFKLGHQRKPYAIALGRIGTNKGIHIAVDACKRAGIRLVIAGQGSPADVGYSEWPDHVDYIGYADTELRKKLLSEASFGFLLSTYWEPFGGTVIEMMLSGCVPIVSDVGAMTEYVVDGVNGFRCNSMGDILRAIRLVNSINRDRMAKFAEANFSLDAVRPKFERAFDDFSDVFTAGGWYEDHNRPMLTGVGLDYRALYVDTAKKTPNDFEKSFWGNCTNTVNEEIKQYEYARWMGLGDNFLEGDGKKILDIGGGPVSMLLKVNKPISGSTVVDPLGYPEWVLARYASEGIKYIQAKGEDEDWVRDNIYDEVWIYNCLQHVDDPAAIIRNAFRCAPILRIFEWINFPAYEGHPQALTQEKMEKWIGHAGNVVTYNQNGCHGDAFYGIFDRALCKSQ
jgi:glycosyltransferase involved in cell wall biosynthesis